ncbi:DUF4291 domain-containing protein [Streptomyces abyssalis]|uniref:DUF4291 domain-containing protein n=1 Tax=Streptomyces abyssalis TaxID=933944 RepID=UPI00099FE775|nr:DUF4291 domain-containing protein [Streptomyces abyssalis]
MNTEASAVPSKRTLRGRYDASTIRVYQAYTKEISERAVAAGTFVPPFKRERMTWIKPSFLWMMYRSGWATKPGQERVLAIDITREGLEWALSRSTLSHFCPDLHESREDWQAMVSESPVRVQWDPDRSLDLKPLDVRAIQIGLSGEAVKRYVENWIVSITDITEMVHEIHSSARLGHVAKAEERLPLEVPYPLPELIRRRISADSVD